MAQIAIAWCLSNDGVTAPVVGATKLENLEEVISEYHVGSVDIVSLIVMVDAIDITLTEEEIKFLEELYKPTAIKGH